MNKLDVLVLTEANINYSLLSFYSLDGYDTNYYTRKGRSGGGVVVFTREGLMARSAGSELSMDSAECVSITLRHHNEQIQVLSIYRPPRINKKDKISQFLIELQQLLHNLPLDKKTIICGDINVNLLKTQDKNVIAYENLLEEYGFVKCINDITRKEIVAEKLVESCIDHIYIRDNLPVIHSSIIKQKISDHYFTTAAVEWKRTRNFNEIQSNNSAYNSTSRRRVVVARPHLWPRDRVPPRPSRMIRCLIHDVC